jgi:thioredoxin-like negative regulator of GroEL
LKTGTRTAVVLSKDSTSKSDLFCSIIILTGGENLKELTVEALREHRGKMVVDFFSNACGVCVAVKRRLESLEADFPQWEFVSVNAQKYPETAGEYSVFTVPTVLILLEGRELNRWSRYFSIEEIVRYLERIDSLR